MKHRGWFTLVLRAIGVFFLGSTLSHLISFITSILLAVIRMEAAATMDWLSWGAGELGIVIQAGFGFYLLFGADKLVAYCLSSVKGLCPMCGYDLGGLVKGRCPECGSVVNAEKSLQDRSGEVLGQ